MKPRSPYKKKTRQHLRPKNLKDLAQFHTNMADFRSKGIAKNKRMAHWHLDAAETILKARLMQPGQPDAE